MNSVSEFFAMGGYALYVWGSFGVTAVLMIIEPLLVKKRRTDVLKRVSRIARLNAAEEKESA
ncbi:heme exporter protein CcmD [Solemya pervernicosa gill symbiont]|uniref:Heme exporter protein D n=2 Tax=Gammaproteobacteria incertae sedis TaxID=118884 RepID=A0A1T2L1U7_9GAMM|nr:heme exporter protein CcmD [Candidatus Reidiella endopervernicosa]OOZ39041.1 heme exporter protein CcmD [Solemya pervernicosa gill symbiont]QKQ27683.1 heme exporter protein CcmD [Candidatus Reidiella endopervernicosa]